MAKNAPVEKTANTVPANPAAIQWPVDALGITSTLKREGCRAAGRINGDDTKLEAFMAVLRTLAGHAQSRHAAGKAEVEARRAAAVQRAEEEAYKQAQGRKIAAADARAKAAALVAEADALDAEDTPETDTE